MAVKEDDLMRAVNLRTEYLKNPAGIDITAPRFFWNCEDGMVQTARRILAEDEQGNVVWDSGKVNGNQMTHIVYGGRKLLSRDHIVWKVKLWDENGQEGDWSEEAYFEMGLLQPSDWHAKWIAGSYRAVKKKRYPADCFLKTFVNDTGNTVKARLYCTACGLYEGKLNGSRIGEFVLAPGLTDYRKRIQYQVYDVLHLLKNGKNRLEFTVADGWYRGSVGAWGMRCYYGKETKLLAQLELTMKDGSVTVIGSDESFRWSNDGQIRFADNKDGEIVNAQKAPSYRGRARVSGSAAVLSASDNVPIKERERLAAKEIRTPSGKKVFDFGQNIAGYVEFSIEAEAGQKLKLRFGEMLDAQGEFTQKNIQCSSRRKTTPMQEIVYICKKGENHYKTRFAIFGFQYMLVETDIPAKPDQFTAIAVYSDMAETLEFDSSNPLLNRLVESTLWSAKNNSADIPTDCPTRERHGWTGDAQIFFNTAGYLLDYAAFARKYERDLTDWQTRDGRFPQIAPEGGTDFYMRVMNGSVGWSDAGVIIPYRFWKLFGDRRMIEDNYNSMKSYAHFMMKRCGRRGILAKNLHLDGKAKRYAVNAGQSYGEWAEPADVKALKWTDMAAPHPEVSTAYTCYVMGLLKEIAAELGKAEDAKLYKRYETGTRYAYQQLVRTSEYSLNTDRQAMLVRPLAFRLLDEKQTEYARKRLILALEHYGWRVGTGFLSTPLILKVLADIDLEAAYRLLENEEMPGWLFMPKNGANTIWESWEGTSAQNGIASLNHYSKGAVCEWLFTGMCGIQVDGRNHFHIEPKPGGHFTYARTSYLSVYGKVVSGWERKDGETTTFTIEVPPNTTADVVFPNGSRQMISAGRHYFNLGKNRNSI